MSSSDDRTTPIGLYHYGRSYHEAARALMATKVNSTHPYAPIDFLFFHAIELFLKSFLLSTGTSLARLEKIRHDIRNLRDRSVKAGLAIEAETDAVLDFIAQDGAIMRSRYIITGLYKEIDRALIDRSCAQIRGAVCNFVSTKSGVRLRP
jgi:hypothetical protein